MGLEERVRSAWESVEQSANQKEGFPRACRALCLLLNVPATAFNEKTALDLVKKKEPVETFIKISDRYPPSFDTEAEDKFRVYLDTYRRIRKEMGTDDVLAFLRLVPTPELRQKAAAWMEGKGAFDWSKPPKK